MQPILKILIVFVTLSRSSLGVFKGNFPSFSLNNLNTYKLKLHRIENNLIKTVNIFTLIKMCIYFAISHSMVILLGHECIHFRYPWTM